MTETTQIHLPLPDPRTAFGGKTYNAEADFARLTLNLRKVFAFLKDGEWHTIPEIAKEVGCSETGASARVRDLRKEHFGSHTVESERAGKGSWRYRLILNAHQAADSA